MNKTLYATLKMLLIALSSTFLLSHTAHAADETGPDVGIQIVGGDPATEGEHPWMVYLSSSAFGSNSYCGASLIAADWVITAAHCIGSGTIYTVAGVYNRSSAGASNTFVVESRYVHPSYNAVSSGNDIALLKLAEPVPTSLVSSYAQLPSVTLDNTYVGTGDTVKVIGWGTTSSGGSQSNILREVFVPVTSESACNSAYGGIDYDTQVCAGFTSGGQDSCQGDSGGPLLFTVSGEDYVAGLVSFGQGCALPNFPGVYTRTAGYLSWISGIVNDDDTGGGTVTELSNGDSISLSGAANSESFFSIRVPAGEDVNISLSGGSGDADLYTRFGALPTTLNYDCRPYLEGNDESCSDSTSVSDVYYIMVQGFSSYSGATLSVSHTGDSDGDNEGGSGTLTDLSAGTQEWTQTYTISVPSGMSFLDVDIIGSNGDADLYVYYNEAPSSTVSSSVDTSTRCVPWNNGSNESCSFSNPAAGTWYVRLYGYSSFSGLTLQSSWGP